MEKLISKFGVEELDPQLECRLRARPYHPSSVPDLTNALEVKWEQTPAARSPNVCLDLTDFTLFNSPDTLGHIVDFGPMLPNLGTQEFPVGCKINLDSKIIFLLHILHSSFAFFIVKFQII